MSGPKLSEIPVKDDVASVKSDADSVKAMVGCSLKEMMSIEDFTRVRFSFKRYCKF